MNEKIDYTAVVRTLGTAGEKYQKLLNSLILQTVKPKDIIVYIAEGYPLPKETVGVERYVYVKKGMVAQRSLPYTEVETEYMLFLDDDVYLSPNSVEILYRQLKSNDANVISPDVFPNSKRSFKNEIMMTLSGRMRARRNDEKWGYKVMRNAGYSYNANPIKNVYFSQTNAGPCFFCTKKDFLDIHFEEELWMDRLGYALGEDQVMFYKMYKKGMKVLTSYNSGIEHLDAGTTIKSRDKEKTLIYADFRFKTIFWHRFIFLPETALILKLWDVLCLGYAFTFTLLISILKGDCDILKLKWSAIKNGISFLKSTEYKSLSRI